MKILYRLYSVLNLVHECRQEGTTVIFLSASHQKKKSPAPGGTERGSGRLSPPGGVDGEDELDRDACRSQGNTWAMTDCSAARLTRSRRMTA